LFFLRVVDKNCYDDGILDIENYVSCAMFLDKRHDNKNYIRKSLDPWKREYLYRLNKSNNVVQLHCLPNPMIWMSRMFSLRRIPIALLGKKR